MRPSDRNKSTAAWLWIPSGNIPFFVAALKNVEPTRGLKAALGQLR